MENIVELLSDTEKTNLVMQNLASYVVYIYPGIISVYLYNFFVARTTKNTQAFAVKSFAISYLYNLLLQVILAKMCFLKEMPDKNDITYNALLIVISFLIPYSCYKFKMSKLFAFICECLGISTSATDIPFELLGDVGEEYTCLKIYIKDEPYVYIGYLGEYEYEEGHEKYVIITGYKKYLINKKSIERLVEGYGAEDYNEKVYIKFDDIKRIEKIEEKRARAEIYSMKKEEK